MITTHPELVPCAKCGENPCPGYVHVPFNRSTVTCGICSGTGRALGSKDVALELTGTHGPEPEHSWSETRVSEGLWVHSYATRAEHDREARRAALRVALEGI